MTAAVLYVDDERAHLDLFVRCFDEQRRVLTASSATEAIALLEREVVAVVATDHRMPGGTGVELLGKVASSWPDVGRLLVTAFSDRELLLEAIREGRVHDYVLKPWTVEDLSLRLMRAVEGYEERRALRRAGAERDNLLERQSWGPIVGLQDALASLPRIAQTDATVLLRGETGTGKELVARALHERSPRAGGPFVRVNCSALAEGLVESELFGHEAGAYTGAVRARAGRFEQAHGGTLFLDEIGDVSPAVQVKLLRVLQEKEIERVGSNAPIRVDVRVVAATHRPLEELVRAGGFRQDLFFRLSVLPLQLPPLRERRAEIPALCRHFLSVLSRELGRPLALTDEAQELLCRYDWPGNARELRNVLERAAVLAEGATPLGREDLLFDFWGAAAPAAPEQTSVFEQADRLEADRIRDALLRAAGSRAGAARLLGIPRTTLNDRIRRLGVR